MDDQYYANSLWVYKNHTDQYPIYIVKELTESNIVRMSTVGLRYPDINSIPFELGVSTLESKLRKVRHIGDPTFNSAKILLGQIINAHMISEIHNLLVELEI